MRLALCVSASGVRSIHHIATATIPRTHARREVLMVMAMTARGEKITDMMVEAHALTDKQFTDWLDQQERDRIEYLCQQSQLDEIEERIRSREIALQCYNGELRLAR